MAVRALAIVAVLAATALAHNGEYRRPLPPPRLDEEPNGPERPATGSEDAPVTPGPDGTTPLPPVSSDPKRPGPRAGFGRDDDRLTYRLWWEANRDRFLPALPEAPHREELLRILTEALGEKDPAVRAQLLLALGRAHHREAGEQLLKELGAKSPEVRTAAITALGLAGTKGAVAPLKKIVLSGEASISDRTFAALALGWLDPDETASFLREVAEEEWQPVIRSAAVLALGSCRDAESTETLGLILLGRHPLRSPNRTPVGDVSVRIGLECMAARALGGVLTPRAYDYLVVALADGEPPVQAAAATVLARAPGTRGVPGLRLAMGGESPLQVRQAALLGLAERGDETAVEMARAILEDPARRDGLMGPFAALALGLTKRRDQTGLLVSVVKDDEAAPETRAAAALALGIAGNRQGVGALEKVLSTCRHRDVAGAALLADAMLGGGQAPAVAKKILKTSEFPEPRRDAVVALGIAGGEDAVEVLVTEFADSYHVNREAALALFRAAPARAVTELTKKLSSPNPNERRFAARSLGMILAAERPDRLARLLASMNLLSDASVMRACLYLENEYLFRRLKGF